MSEKNWGKGKGEGGKEKRGRGAEEEREQRVRGDRGMMKERGKIEEGEREERGRREERRGAIAHLRQKRSEGALHFLRIIDLLVQRIDALLDLELGRHGVKVGYAKAISNRTDLTRSVLPNEKMTPSDPPSSSGSDQ